MFSQTTLYWIALCLWSGFGIAVLPALLKIPAPYGRAVRKGWGPEISSRTGWFLMELPGAVVLAGFFLYCHVAGSDKNSLAVSLVFLVLWEVHYINRAIIYPFRIRGHQSQITVSVIGMGIVFNIINGYFNGSSIFCLGAGHEFEWFYGARFLTGTAVFLYGMFINLKSDSILRNLRRQGGDGYSIPRGFLFEYVSCPNYFGEILEWFGWAILTWSVGGLSFLIWTLANLVPRGIYNHRWYKETFADYPACRKAIFPGLL